MTDRRTLKIEGVRELMFKTELRFMDAVAFGLGILALVVMTIAQAR